LNGEAEEPQRCPPRSTKCVVRNDVLLSDDFDDGILDDRWIVAGYASPYVSLKSRPLPVDPDKKLIISFKSTFRKDIMCTDAWFYINNLSIRCRKRCDVAENIQVICDLKSGLTQCFVDGEEIARRENTPIRITDGTVQIRFVCSNFEKWELDDVRVWQ
jgi:hypothetical protein